MGLFSNLLARFKPPQKRDFGDGWSNFSPFSAHSNTGVDVNQYTSLKATTVMACVTMLCEDFAKCEPSIFYVDDKGRRIKAKNHELFDLLETPNDWQTGFEFREMMQFSLVLRGNAYAAKIRNKRGEVIKLVPINADWVALWEAPTGELYWRVTPNGLHMMHELVGQPFLIPDEDILHIKGLSMNGLTGISRISVANDAIGLALAYERQAAQWMSNSASLSGVLSTDQKLTEATAERLRKDWKEKKAGLSNAGNIAVLEQGLKFLPTSMSAQAAEFVNSRNFQIQEITRIFRIPPHMIGDLQRATNNNIEQLSQEYINLTITGYTQRWAARFSRDWGLKKQDLRVDFDLSILTRANITARYNNYARGITGGFLTQNECRIDDGRDPLENGDVLLQPLNMIEAGSHSTGAKADGGGRPENNSADASVTPKKLN